MSFFDRLRDAAAEERRDRHVWERDITGAVKELSGKFDFVLRAVDEMRRKDEADEVRLDVIESEMAEMKKLTKQIVEQVSSFRGPMEVLVRYLSRFAAWGGALVVAGPLVWSVLGPLIRQKLGLP